MPVLDPIAVLYAEHEEGLKALERLSVAARQLEEQGWSAPVVADIKESAAFINGEIRRHNEKEEVALFPQLRGAIPYGPVDVMLAEHRDLWELEDHLEELLAGPQTDAARADLAVTAQEIVDLLTSHIGKENNILFPMARQVLSPTQMAVVARKFEELAVAGQSQAGFAVPG